MDTVCSVSTPQGGAASPGDSCTHCYREDTSRGSLQGQKYDWTSKKAWPPQHPFGNFGLSFSCRWSPRRCTPKTLWVGLDLTPFKYCPHSGGLFLLKVSLIHSHNIGGVCFKTPNPLEIFLFGKKLLIQYYLIKNKWVGWGGGAVKWQHLDNWKAIKIEHLFNTFSYFDKNRYYTVKDGKYRQPRQSIIIKILQMF